MPGILFLCFISTAGTGQEYRFHNLTITDGLLDNSVYEVFEDSHGFIWIGSSRGLQRYDGHEFTSFTHDSSDPQGLMDGFIRALAEDRDGGLWVGSQNGGLARYHDGVFAHFKATDDKAGLSHDYVESLLSNDDGSVWIGTWGGGLNHYHNGVFKVYKQDDQAEYSINNDNVVSLAHSRDGGLWIGLWRGGLDYFKDGKFKHIDLSSATGLPKALSARCLLQASDGSLWVGVWEGGLIRYKDGKVQEYYRHEQGKPGGLSNNNLLALSEGADGSVWASTFGGGTHRIKGGEIIVSKKIKGDVASLTADRIECSYVDSRGNLWLGTNGGGISKLVDKGFRSFKEIPNGSNGLLNDQISVINGDGKGAVYMGSWSGGFSRLENGAFIHVLDGNDRNVNSNITSITAVQVDENDDIFLAGVSQTLVKYSKGIFREVPFNSPKSFGRIYQLFRDMTGKLHASSWGAGLIELGTGKLYSDFGPSTTNIGGNDVHCSVVDAQNRIWVGTHEAGVSMISEGKVVKTYQHSEAVSGSLDSNHIKSLLSASDGSIWVGTWGGALNKIDPETGAIKIFRNREEFDSDVQSLLEDKKGNIWMGTGKGIALFDPEVERFFNFSYSDGVDAQPFIAISAYRDPSTGIMYFGGENGVTTFHPEDVVIDTIPPTLLISGLTVADEDYLSRLREGETSGRFYEIQLDHGQNSINIEFAAINTKGKYSYCLDGFDAGWHPPSERRFANYTNLPSGRYIFKVRGSNQHGIWGSDYASIPIFIRPAIWETLWFRAVGIMTLVAILYLSIRYRTNVIHRRNKELEQKVHERTEEYLLKNRELNSALTQLKETQAQLVQSEKMAALGVLTAGVAHEINNPVNFVYAGISSLEDNLKSVRQILEAYDNVDSTNAADRLSDIERLKSDLEYDKLMGLVDKSTGNVKNGAQRTSEIVQGLRTFSRTDDNSQSVTNLEESIDSTLLLLSSQYKDRIRIKRNYGNIPPIKCYPGKINQVFVNIVGNAIQAIPGEGVITISTVVKESHRHQFVQITIEDSGCGIAEENKSRVFEPFFTTKDEGKGTGLGLFISHSIIEEHGGDIELESQPGLGTKFRINLPIRND